MRYFLYVYTIGELVPSTILVYDSAAARENDFHNLRCADPQGWFVHTRGMEALHIPTITRIVCRDET